MSDIPSPPPPPPRELASWITILVLWSVFALIAFVPPLIGASTSSDRRYGLTFPTKFFAGLTPASALRIRLSVAQNAARNMRTLTTFRFLSVAWIIGLCVNLPILLEGVEPEDVRVIDMALGILAVILGTTIHRSRDVLFFLTAPMFAVVYQAMLLLSCRPLDTVGVRLVGLIIGLEFLYTTLGTEMHEAELLWTDGVECAGLRYAFLAARAVWGGAFAAACVAAAWSCSSRRALGRLWITMRIACPTALLLPTTHPGLRLFWGDCAVTADAGTQYPLAGVTGTLIWSVTGTVIFTLLLTERNRGRLAHWIAGAGEKFTACILPPASYRLPPTSCILHLTSTRVCALPYLLHLRSRPTGGVSEARCRGHAVGGDILQPGRSTG